MFEIQDGVLKKYTGHSKIVKIPDGVFRIGGLAFASAPITQVYLPPRIGEISSSAFYHCTELESIIIPYDLDKIGVHAFYKCPSLKNIYIYQDHHIANYALSGELSNAYWSELKGRAFADFLFPSEQVSADILSLMDININTQRVDKPLPDTPPAEPVMPQSDPLEQRVAALEALVASQQAQIAQLTERLKALTPPRRITSFHPLSEEELRRL